jgi:hypothetical protein
MSMVTTVAAGIKLIFGTGVSFIQSKSVMIDSRQPGKLLAIPFASQGPKLTLAPCA